MPHPVFHAGNTALITGGASGIGLAIAHTCASHGLNVYIVDINTSQLESAVESISSKHSNIKISPITADVSSSSDWQRIKSSVEGNVNLLVLNAGTSKKTSEWDVDAIRQIWETNVFGVVNGIATITPEMKKNHGQSAIVITGSKQGITNPPGNPGYNASKSAVKTLAEHLSFELRDTPISVHLLVPGWTHTGLTGASAGGAKPAGAWTSEQVAEHLFKKMEEEKFYVLCPDNDVTEDMDRKRIAWAAGDLVEGRPALSRWRGGEWGEKHKQFMES